MRKGSVFTILSFVLLLWSCGEEAHLIKNSQKRSAVEEKFQKRTEEFLHQRKEQLLTVLDNATTAEQEALKFLYAYSPLSDLSNYDGDYFLGQVQYALKARETFSWGKLVSEDDFLHFVLPSRAGSENLDTARQVIFHELLPRISGMSMKEAALEINHWCHEKVIYMGTDGRTSAPLASIKTAFGRCGEESVLAVTALRAVGIPARQIYTPRWVHQDSNHAWVEFWADGQWYFYGACEPEPDVNIAWFTEPARRSMITLTTTPGHYHSDLIVNREENYTQLNQVDNYTQGKDLVVRVEDTSGNPVEDATVRYLVYNYAQLYPLATLSTNAQGFSTLRLGLGNVVVWANEGDLFDFAHISVETTDTLMLILGNREQEEYSLELEMNPPAIQNPLPVSKQARAENNLRLAQEDSIRHAYESTFLGQSAAKEFALKHKLNSEQFASIILQSRGNWGDILRFVEDADGNPMVLPLLGAVAEKDLRDAPAEVLLSHLNSTPERKKGISEDIWVKYVLNPRISLEMLTPYKEDLPKLLGDKFFKEVSQNPEVALQWVEENITLVGYDEDYTVASVVPRGAVEMRATDIPGRDILFVALCRTAGVPARLNEVTGNVEYWQNGWVQAFAPVAKEASQKPAHLTFSYKGDESCKYWSNFTLSYFENGYFKTLTFDRSLDVREFPKSIEVEPGYYMLVTGNRLNDGSVLSNVSFHRLASGQAHTLPVQLREDDNALQALAQINLPDFINISDGSKSELGQLIKTYGAATLIWLDPGKEPTRHVLKDLKEMKEAFDELSMPFLFFVPQEKQTASFNYNELILPDNSDMAVDTDMLQQLSQAFNRNLDDEFPVIAMVNVHGDVLYFSSGYTIGMGDRVLKTYKQLRRMDDNE